MIELPEAAVIAQQMADCLTGKKVAKAVFGQSPHKFAFANHEPEAYAEALTGQSLGKARAHGNAILVPVGKSWVLVLGGGGERILFHTEESTLPKRRHLLLRFSGNTTRTVTDQGWGNVLILRPSELPTHSHIGSGRPSSLDTEFTSSISRPSSSLSIPQEGRA